MSEAIPYSERKYLKVSEVPIVYPISRDKIYRWQRAKKIKLHKVDGASMVKVSDIEAIIEAGVQA